jgi:hypothetical protein
MSLMAAATMGIVHCPSPKRQRITGLSHESCNKRVWATPQRGRTTGGIAITMGGPGNDNVKVLAMRATDCQHQLPQEVARVSGGRQ